MSPSPYLQDSDFTLFCGDSRSVLADLPAESVHMAVTSPPFFGLRDYGNEGQIGLESTPEEWVAQLVAVFEEVRRVLRKDGTLWVECGDSYNNRSVARKSSHQGGLGFESDDLSKSWADLTTEGRTRLSFTHGGMKEKDLIGQPFALAFALREAGWYWRNVCIWHKPNPMPESVRDRFTVSHSYVLLFSKSPRYYMDMEAVREAYEYGENGDHARSVDVRYHAPGQPQHTGLRRQGLGAVTPGPQDETLDGSEGEALRGPDGRRATAVKAGDNSIQHRDGERWPNSGRNARSVWTIPTEPLPFEHYAAFPQALAERCIKAGTSERGCCPECGAPWVREVETTRRYIVSEGGSHADGTYKVRYSDEPHDVNFHSGKPDEAKDYNKTRWHNKVVGFEWRPSCDHRELVTTPGQLPYTYETALAPIPCTVLDPFLGSGTSALVSRRLGRRCIGIELNERYCELAAKRTQQLSLESEVA